MKKIPLLIFTLILSAITIAQHNHPSHSKPGQKDKSIHRKEFAEKLGITEAQKQQMRQLHKEEREKGDALYQNNSMTLGAYKQQKEALRKEYSLKRDNVYTKEQKEKLEQIKVEREKAREIDQKARMDKMALKLGLDEKQKEQMEAQHKQFKEQAEVIKANEKLSMEEQKKQLKALRESHHSKMNSILSAEQQKLIQEKKQRK